MSTTICDSYNRNLSYSNTFVLWKRPNSKTCVYWSWQTDDWTLRSATVSTSALFIKLSIVVQKKLRRILLLDLQFLLVALAWNSSVAFGFGIVYKRVDGKSWQTSVTISRCAASTVHLSLIKFNLGYIFFIISYFQGGRCICIFVT